MKVIKHLLLLLLFSSLLIMIGCSKQENVDDSGITENESGNENVETPSIDIEDGENEELEEDKEEDVPPVEIAKKQEIEYYLGLIHLDYVSRVSYSTYKNITNYYGYIFLYNGESVNVNQDLVGSNLKATRPGIKKTSIDWIVIHDTANNTTTANAYSHSKYLKSNPGVSWHYVVDSQTIYQNIPDNEVAYHAGDGLRETGTVWYSSVYNKQNFGGGNANGIGIETCVNSGSDYNETLMNTASLVAELLIKYNLTIDSVKQHYNFSGKTCPRALIESARWSEFLKLVEICYYYKMYLNDVDIQFEIITTKYLNNKGMISNNITSNTVIQYKAIVTYQEVVVEYYFQVRCN